MAIDMLETDKPDIGFYVVLMGKSTAVNDPLRITGSVSINRSDNQITLSLNKRIEIPIIQKITVYVVEFIADFTISKKKKTWLYTRSNPLTLSEGDVYMPGIKNISFAIPVIF